MTKPETHLGTIGNAAMIGAFLAIILLPGFAQIANWDPMPPIDERRTMAEFPELDATRESIEAFPDAFENYYRDNYGLRNTLIRWRNYIYYAVFSVSPTERVILANEGWAFVGWPEARVYMRREAPENPTWAEDWSHVLRERHQWLQQKGISFTFGITPESYTAYSEYLPTAMKSYDTPSRQDILLESAKAHTSVNLIDFRPALFEAKEQGTELLYQKLDGHWQDTGAYIAYRELIDELAEFDPSLEPLPLSEFELTKIRKTDGALARMLSLPLELGEEYGVLKPKHDLGEPQLQYRNEPIRWVCQVINRECESGSVLIFTDSYGEYLIPFIPQNFRRTFFVSIWHQDFTMNWLEKFVADQNPDHVIWIMAERWLVWTDPATLHRQ